MGYSRPYLSEIFIVNRSHFNPPELNHARRVRPAHTPRVKIRIPLLDPLREPHVKLQQDPRHDELDLVGGEEPARAGVLAEPEARVLLGDADELVRLARAEAVGVGRLVLGAQVVEPVRVEHFRVWVVVRVVQHREAGGLDVCARRDVGPVFEGDGFVDVAPERVWGDN